MSDGITRRRAALLGGAALAGSGCLGRFRGDDEATTVPAEAGVEHVSFEAPHGATVEGTLYGSGTCGVVLVPQVNLDRPSWQPQAELLADRGSLALAIDEDPDDRPVSVVGAARYLRGERSVERLALVGASSGGEAVVRAGAELGDDADAVVGLSAAGGEERADELRGRSLFVVAEDDEDRFVETARALREAAPDPSELVVYEGEAHGQELFDGEHGEDLRERLLGLLETVCE